MNGPRIVCVACQVTEVNFDQLCCRRCRPQLEQAGLLDAPTSVDTTGDLFAHLATSPAPSASPAL